MFKIVEFALTRPRKGFESSKKGGQRRRGGMKQEAAYGISACPSFRLEVEKNLTAHNDEARRWPRYYNPLSYCIIIKLLQQ